MGINRQDIILHCLEGLSDEQSELVHELYDMYERLAKEHDDLRTENEALKPNAERYRLLQELVEDPKNGAELHFWVGGDAGSWAPWPMSCEDFDEIIDSLRGEEK